MSGGSFDYVHSRVETFADELSEVLRLDVEGDPAHAFSPAVSAKLRQIQTAATMMAKLMREVDYLCSCDTGDDTFLQRVAEIETGNR